MLTLFVAFIIVAATTAYADDFEDLKAASVRSVAGMKATLALSDGTDCSETGQSLGRPTVDLSPFRTLKY
jgi:hypothetical protein